ncbi:DUF6573 family protein [Niallia taxi]|uniref:DUF6573 family protein n=1 Tax=Niallia taxi TaxID=2499688 RepID=UPI003D296B59
MEDIFGTNYISIYTRAEAMEDGELIDVTKQAKETGFKIPVAVTRTIWFDVIQPDEQAKTMLQFFVRWPVSIIQQ